MPRQKREGEPQVRIHTWIYERDKQRLDALYGQTVGHSKVIRLIVRKFLDGIEAKAMGRAAPIADAISQEEMDDAKQ